MLQLLLVALVFVCTVGFANALELREVWRFQGGDVVASPTLLRKTAGGPIAGIVFTVADGRLVRLDGNGKVAWTHPIARFSHTAPAIGDVDGDGGPEVVALDADGVLHCLADDGTVKWTARLRAGGRQQGGAGLYDLDGDGAREIVVGDAASMAWCLDGRGNVRWTLDVGSGRFCAPTFADLNGDGKAEIIIGEGSGRRCYCLTSDGEWLWELWRPDDVFVNSNATVADVTGDGRPEVFVGGGLHHFYALAGRTGEPLRELNTRDHINSAMASGDLDGRGVVDVVFATRNRFVYRIGRGAETVWATQVAEAVMAAPAIADINGDGRAEIILHLRDGGLVVLDADGKEVAGLPLGDAGWSAPAVGDVNGDGKLEILALGGRSTDLVCLATAAEARPGAVRWESLRGDAACTGNPAGVRATRSEPIRHPEARGATFAVTSEFPWLCGTNERTYALRNPDARNLLLSLSVVRPDGRVDRVLRHAVPPAATVNCGLFVDASGRYRLDTRLLDVDTRAVLEKESSEQTVDLFARDVDLAKSTVAGFDKAVTALAGAPADARDYLRWAQLQVRGQAQRLEDARRAPLSSADKAKLIQDDTALRRRSGHLLRLCEFIASRPAAERGRAFAAWESFPWHRFEAQATAPALGAPKSITFEAYLGERTSACVGITSFRGGAAAYRVEMGELKHPGSGQVLPASSFELREAVEAPTDSARMVADALAPLNDTTAVLVGPWESRQLWVTLTTAKDVAPGEYTGELNITSIEAFPVTEKIAVRVRVWPITMAFPGRFRYCNWGTTPGADDDYGRSLVRLVVDHRVNTITSGCPRAEFDEKGQLVGTVNFEATDRELSRYPQATFLFAVPQRQFSVPGAELFSEKWIAAYRKYLAEWMQHLEQRGIGYDRFLFYPVDEATIAGSGPMREITDTARITEQINPRIRIYANPSMGATIEGLTELSQYVDVWCPSQELIDREAPAILDFFKRTGQEVWFYDARGEARVQSGLAFYRRGAWQAWHFGLTGMGYFACIATPQVAWLGPNFMGQGGYWDLVYPGSRAVPSKRYEGATDGKQDFEAMLLLRDALEAAKAAGVAGGSVQEAQRLLGDEAEAIWQAINALDDTCEVTTDGAAAREVVEKLRAFRRRVAELTVELRDRMASGRG